MISGVADDPRGAGGDRDEARGVEAAPDAVPVIAGDGQAVMARDGQAELLMGFLADFHAAGRSPAPPEPPVQAGPPVEAGGSQSKSDIYRPREADPLDCDAVEVLSDTPLPVWPPRSS